MLYITGGAYKSPDNSDVIKIFALCGITLYSPLKVKEFSTDYTALYPERCSLS
jgi:hypothetical protein